MIDSIVRKVADSYLATALWAECDWDDCPIYENPVPLDTRYSFDDWSDRARKRAYDECKEFVDKIDSIEIDEDRTLFDCADELQGLDRIGHDLWLTHAGHGAGFWDGDYAEYGDSLTSVVYALFGRYSERIIWKDEEGRLDYE